MKNRHSILLLIVLLGLFTSAASAVMEMGLREVRMVMELKRHLAGEVRFHFQFDDTPEGRSFSAVMREEFDSDPSGHSTGGMHNVSTKDVGSDEGIISWIAHGEFQNLAALLVAQFNPIPEYELRVRDRMLEYRIAPFPPGQGPIKGITTFEVVFVGTVLDGNAYEQHERNGKHHLIWHERRLPEEGLHFRIRPE